MCGRYVVRIERLGDLTEAPSARILEPDPVDGALRQRRRPASGVSTRAVARWLEMFSNESLKLRDGNEPLTPRRLDCAHRRDEAAVDGRDAATGPPPTPAANRRDESVPAARYVPGGISTLHTAQTFRLASADVFLDLPHQGRHLNRDFVFT